MPVKNKKTLKKKQVTFEELMFTIMSATQDTFRMYMNTEIFAGQTNKTLEPLVSDIAALVGVAGERVGYVMISADRENAARIARKMMMTDEVSDDVVTDAFGELANNIGGVVRSKYFGEMSGVALGLPLVVAGRVLPPHAATPEAGAPASTVNIQSKGVTIPFRSFNEDLTFQVMVYM